MPVPGPATAPAQAKREQEQQQGHRHPFRVRLSYLGCRFCYSSSLLRPGMREAQAPSWLRASDALTEPGTARWIPRAQASKSHCSPSLCLRKGFLCTHSGATPHWPHTGLLWSHCKTPCPPLSHTRKGDYMV